MRPSIDDPFDPSRQLTSMSTQGPSNPLGHRPRMVEALASLKEGLRDTADPLYDGWKLRPRAPASPNIQPPTFTDAADLPNAPTSEAADLLADGGETIDILLDGTPSETPVAEREPEPEREFEPEPEPDTPRLGDDGDVDDPATPRLNDWFADGLPTEEQLIDVIDEADGLPTEERLIEVFDEAAAPFGERKISVQADTVRVRVIRYRPFPRWALVVVAGLVVFAASLLALRARFPRDGTRSSRSVLASEVPVQVPVRSTDRAEIAASPATVAVSPPVVAPPSSAGPRPSSPALPEVASRAAAPAVDSNRARHSAIDPPPAPTTPAPPAAKTPSPSPRRRPTGHDFFRDPGF